MPKVGIIIITYNQADLLPRQLDCLQRFCQDEYKVIIIDNSTHLEQRQAVKYHARNCTYIRCKAHSNNGSESHAFAANLSHTKFKDDFDFLFWLDHDCFPFAPFSVERTLDGKVAAGLLQVKEQTYFWPGCFMVDAKKVNDVDFSVAPGLDTGGMTHKIIDTFGIDNCVQFSEVHEENPYFNKTRYNFYSVINETFMHYINGSDWAMTGHNEERLNSLHNVLKNKCEAA